jgi:tetratricopeptide (TPR) repeat protein
VKAGDDAAGKGDYEAAVKEYTTAINVGPKKNDVYVRRGKALYKLGRVDEAIKDCSEVLEDDVKHARTTTGDWRTANSMSTKKRVPISSRQFGSTQASQARTTIWPGYWQPAPLTGFGMENESSNMRRRRSN